MLDSWETWISSIPNDPLLVYTYDSMNYAECIPEKYFTQPKSIRKATFAQGGLRFYNEDDLMGSVLTRSLTVTLCSGTVLNLPLPSSLEIYSLFLAAHLLAHSIKSGTIYTDFLEAVKGTIHHHTFRNMSRNPNL